MINVKAATTAQLIAYYNANSGKDPVKKFRDRATAEARVTAILPPAPKGKRVEEVLELLQGGKVTVKEMMAHFDTVYKNITGDLFTIRKAGIKLVKERTPNGDFAFSIAC